MKFLKKNKMILFLIFILTSCVIYACFDFNRYGDSAFFTNPILLYYQILENDILYFFIPLAPLFVMIPTIYNFNKELSSGNIRNSLSRIPYKTYIKKYYHSAFKMAFIFTYTCILLFICAGIMIGGFYVKGDLALYGSFSSPDLEWSNNPYLYIILYLMINYMHGVFCANIGLFYCKKNKNFLVCLILSYLTYIGLEIFSEIFIGSLLLTKIFGIHNISFNFNFFSAWQLYNVNELLVFGIAVFLLITSSFLVRWQYRNKEGVLIEVEK